MESKDFKDAWISLFPLPKCPKFYYDIYELRTYLYLKRVPNFSIQSRNLRLSELLEFEKTIQKYIYKVFESDNIDDLSKLRTLIILLPDMKGYFVLRGTTTKENANEYHFNLPIKSKLKNPNLVFERMVHLLYSKANDLLNNFNEIPKPIKECYFQQMLSIIQTHTDMILQCMLYHRPWSYEKLFKETTRGVFNLPIIDQPPFNNIKLKGM
jgi:hypothetical protein